jgi:hypothetical protein
MEVSPNLNTIACRSPPVCRKKKKLTKKKKQKLNLTGIDKCLMLVQEHHYQNKDPNHILRLAKWKESNFCLLVFFLFCFFFRHVLMALMCGVRKN